MEKSYSWQNTKKILRESQKQYLWLAHYLKHYSFPVVQYKCNRGTEMDNRDGHNKKSYRKTIGSCFTFWSHSLTQARQNQSHDIHSEQVLQINSKGFLWICDPCSEVQLSAVWRSAYSKKTNSPVNKDGCPATVFPATPLLTLVRCSAD